MTFSIHNSEQVREVLKQAGAIHVGIQCDHHDQPALLLFNAIRSTLSVEIADIDGQPVDAVIALIRERVSSATV